MRLIRGAGLTAGLQGRQAQAQHLGHGTEEGHKGHTRVDSWQQAMQGSNGGAGPHQTHGSWTQSEAQHLQPFGMHGKASGSACPWLMHAWRCKRQLQATAADMMTPMHPLHVSQLLSGARMVMATRIVPHNGAARWSAFRRRIAAL